VFYKDTGIALVANASKATAQTEGVEEAPFTNTPLAFALEAFLANVNEVSGAVEDFTATFDTKDKKALGKTPERDQQTTRGELEGRAGSRRHRHQDQRGDHHASARQLPENWFDLA